MIMRGEKAARKLNCWLAYDKLREGGFFDDSCPMCHNVEKNAVYRGMTVDNGIKDIILCGRCMATFKPAGMGQSLW